MMGGRNSYHPNFRYITVFAAFFIISIAVIPLLNVRLNPSHTLPSLRINYNWPNASARLVELQVTSKLEGVMGSINGLKKISSVSRKGGGSISLEFVKDTDMDITRFMVSSLIKKVYDNFPKDVSYPSITVKKAGGKNKTLMVFTISSSDEPVDIQNFTEEEIASKLTRVKGIENINVYGASERIYKITFNESLVKEIGLNAIEIRNIISNAFNNKVLGSIRQSTNSDGAEEITIRLKNTNTNIWRIPIYNINQRIVYLTDIATVVKTERPPNSYYRINGKNTVNMVIFANSGVNEIKLGRTIYNAVNEIKRELPSEYQILVSYDSTDYMVKEVRKTFFRSLLSLLFLIVFVYFFNRNFKYLLLLTISLIANLVLVLFLYYLLDIELHIYSLAGITVSFGIIIDNSIVMLDHYRYHRNKKVFLAILAATTTTIGSLAVIFFLSEKQRANLADFAWVMMANLSVSLVVAYYLIPSLTDVLMLKKSNTARIIHRQRKLVKLQKKYLSTILFTKRFRLGFTIIFILGFGIPVHWLPDKVYRGSLWADLYNNSLGTETFTHDIRPLLEKMVGGSLRLFSENVIESSFYHDTEQTQLIVRGKMPEGCTVQQMNEAVVQIEKFLSQFKEIKSFETIITSYKNSSLIITFKPEHELGLFPHYLKNELVNRAVQIGGVDSWSVYGVGKGFTNSLHKGYKRNQIILEGYNYDQLYKYAVVLKDSLENNQRVKDLEISGRLSWDNQLVDEFWLEFDSEYLAICDIHMKQYFNELKLHGYETNILPINDGNHLTPVSIVSSNAESFNTWLLKNFPVIINETMNKVSNVASFDRRPIGVNIYRNNQQYTLTVAWNYVGPTKMAKAVQHEYAEKIGQILPIGFKTKERNNNYWNKKDKKQYYLIGVILLIIFFICSILLESLIQPLAIISLIPISFIGVFLTFYVFDFNFDQGGFASFISLAGITVNSALYIVNDFNQYRKQDSNRRPLALYMKAFNHKIVPVILTVLSTIFGLLPFIIGGQKEVFWFSFAVGAVGGMLFSLIALFIYFPLFIRLDSHNPRNYKE